VSQQFEERLSEILVLPLSSKEKYMGKYFLAWLLGVPAFVLIIIYLLMG
jgi:hypothetical protein